MDSPADRKDKRANDSMEERKDATKYTFDGEEQTIDGTAKGHG